MNEINKIWYIKGDEIRNSIYCDKFRRWSRSKWAIFDVYFDEANYFERFDDWWAVYREEDNIMRLMDSKRITPKQWYLNIYDWDRWFDDEELYLTVEERELVYKVLKKFVNK